MGDRTGGKRSAETLDATDDEDWLCPTDGCCGVWYDIDEERPSDTEPTDPRPAGGSSSPIIRMDGGRRVEFTQTEEAANSWPQSAATTLPPPPVVSSNSGIDALSMTQPIMIYATNPDDLAVMPKQTAYSTNITPVLPNAVDEERVDRKRIQCRRFPRPPPTTHHCRNGSNTTTSNGDDRRQRCKRHRRKCYRDARRGQFHLTEEAYAWPSNNYHSDAKMVDHSKAKINGLHHHHRQPCTSPPQRLVVWGDDVENDMRKNSADHQLSDLRQQLLTLQAQLLVCANGAARGISDGSGYVKMMPLVDLVRQKAEKSQGGAKKEEDGETTASTFVRYGTLHDFMASAQHFNDRIKTELKVPRSPPKSPPPPPSDVFPRPVRLPPTSIHFGSLVPASSAAHSLIRDESRNDRKSELNLSYSVSSGSVTSAKRTDAATETTGSNVSTFRSNTASAADLTSVAPECENDLRPDTVESAAQTEDPTVSHDYPPVELSHDYPPVEDELNEKRVRDRNFTTIPLSIQRSPTLLSAAARFPQMRLTRRRRTSKRQQPLTRHSPSPSTQSPTTPMSTPSGHSFTTNKFTFPSNGLLNVPHTPRNHSLLPLPSPRKAETDADSVTISTIRIPAQRIVRTRRAFNTRRTEGPDAERIATDNEAMVRSHSGTPLPLIQTLRNDRHDRHDDDWRSKSPSLRHLRRNPSKRLTNDARPSKHDFNLCGFPNLTISPRINNHHHHRRMRSPEETSQQTHPKHKIRHSSVRHDHTSKITQNPTSFLFAHGVRRTSDSPPTSVVQHVHHTVPIIKPPRVRGRPRGQQVVVRATSGGSLAARGNSTAGRHRRARSVRISALPPPTRTQFVVGRPCESRPVYLSTPESSFVTTGPRYRSTSKEHDRSITGTQLTMTPLSISGSTIEGEHASQKRKKKRKAYKKSL